MIYKISLHQTFGVACMDLAIDLIHELVMYGESLSAGLLGLRI